MRFDEYLTQHTSTDQTDIFQSDWLDLSELSLSDDAVGVFDFAVLGNDIKAKIALSAGDYRIQAQIIFKDKHRHVSAMRVIAGDTAERGAHVADVNVDCPQIAIADYHACLNATNYMDEDEEQAWFGHINPHQFGGVAQLPSPHDLTLAFVQPGFGDGIYPVYELLRDGNIVGMELVFINALGQPPRAYASRFAADFPAFAALLASGHAEPVQDMERPATDDDIAEAEAEIGVPLPASYKKFLELSAGVSLSCGSIVFGTSHLYFHEFEPFEHLPHHQQEQLLHHERRWPPPSEGFLCFADFWMEGEGDQALFDVKNGLIDGEYPVIFYHYEQDAVSPLAMSFADWLERIVSGKVA